MEPIGSHETSVSNHLRPHNNPRVGRIYFNRGGSVSSRLSFGVHYLSNNRCEGNVASKKEAIVLCRHWRHVGPYAFLTSAQREGERRMWNRRPRDTRAVPNALPLFNNEISNLFKPTIFIADLYKYVWNLVWETLFIADDAWKQPVLQFFTQRHAELYRTESHFRRNVPWLLQRSRQRWKKRTVVGAKNPLPISFLLVLPPKNSTHFSSPHACHTSRPSHCT